VSASLAVTLHSERSGPADPGRRLVLVHGFTQTARCWAPIDADLAAAGHEVVSIDAPGHGGGDGGGDGSAIHERADLSEAAWLLAEAGGPGIYIGYSMGARMALHVALHQRTVVRGLVLVGGTPGIADDAERATRRRRDHVLAQRVRDEGVDAFLQVWLAQPLFAGLPPSGRFDDERRRNSAEGLASSLELCGTGSQRSLWGELSTIDVPTLVIAGADDAKFAAIAQQTGEAIGPNATTALVPGAGHTAHLEQPAAFLDILRPWLARYDPSVPG
jgi:2-succinyl-6-hydroxy-2,4-cyclohexadiene-1-carboxylate synthase